MFDTAMKLARVSGLGLALGLATFGGAGAPPAAALSTPEVARRVTETLHPPADVESIWRQQVKVERLQCEFGGWTGVTVASYKNDDNDRNSPDAVTTLMMRELRLWSRMWLRDGSTAYVRLRQIGYGFQTADGVTDPNMPSAGFDLDLGYVDVAGWGGTWRLGRQYVRLGSGIALDGTLDGARLTGQRGSFGYGLLLARNKPGELDVDSNISVPRRVFEGVDFQMLRHDQHRLFGFMLVERDHSLQPSGISGAAQGFHYDAEYLGAGLDGRLSRNMDYHLEGIRQTGQSFYLGSGTLQNDIAAWAGLGSLTHHQDRPMHPVYSLEYAFSSGDAGRLPGISTVSNNLAAQDDKSFLGFGRYEGGVALNPRLSNLCVLRLGASARPWDETPGFEDLTLGGKFSLYRKADSVGGISDPEATNPSADVGNGLDLYLGWRIFTDLSWMLQYGVFNPGAAYPAAVSDATQAFYSNMTWSF